MCAGTHDLSDTALGHAGHAELESRDDASGTELEPQIALVLGVQFLQALGLKGTAEIAYRVSWDKAGRVGYVGRTGVRMAGRQHQCRLAWQVWQV